MNHGKHLSPGLVSETSVNPDPTSVGILTTTEQSFRLPRPSVFASIVTRLPSFKSSFPLVLAHGGTGLRLSSSDDIRSHVATTDA